MKTGKKTIDLTSVYTLSYLTTFVCEFGVLLADVL